MKSPIIDFLSDVVSNHALATGIKKLSSHYEIVKYANDEGYNISLPEWMRYHIQEWANSGDNDLDMIFRCDETHWSWAFRQNSSWRKLLIGGSITDGIRKDFNGVANGGESMIVDIRSDVKNGSKDTEEALDLFIIEINSREDLKAKIRECRDQDAVIEIARQYGFRIDSMSILKKWSKVTDFTKPTWFGWFND